MADGSEKQYDAISYSYHQAGTLLQFETAAHEQMSVTLPGYVKSVRVLEIDAAVTDPTITVDRDTTAHPCAAVHTGHGTD